MTSTLRSNIQTLAHRFANDVLNAIRSASLEELLAESGGRSGGRLATRAPAPRASGRLPRRSADDVAKVVEQIHSLVKKHKDGLRAEDIRKQLGMQAKELPRPLGEALKSKKLRKKGQKRATTYFAA